MHSLTFRHIFHSSSHPNANGNILLFSTQEINVLSLVLVCLTLSIMAFVSFFLLSAT